MAENSRGILKFNRGEDQELPKPDYGFPGSTDIPGHVASDPETDNYPG